MNRFNTGYPEIERITDDDLSELLDKVDRKWGLDIQLVDLDISEIDHEYDQSTTFKISPTFMCEGEEFSISYELLDDASEPEYIIDEVTIYDIHDAYMHRYYMSMNQPHDAQAFLDRIDNRGNVSIEASTAIMAADEDDPFSDMGFDDPEGEAEPDLAPAEDNEDVSDSIDDMADTLDDLNDALDDFEEDDVDIETENNIDDHFIAECEKCHGVFITSIIESDQEIEKISGICPLCDEECDQYLKWVIKGL